MIDEVPETQTGRGRLWLRRGILIELIGALALLFASRYAETGWTRAFWPPLPLASVGAPAWLPAALVAVGLAAMVLGYAMSLRAIGRLEPDEQPELQSIMLLVLLLALPLLLLNTIPSDDLYRYAFAGRIEAVYHANPYVDPPDRFGSDPFLPFFNGDRGPPLVDGPAWQFLSSMLVAYAGPDAPPTFFVLIYKFLGLLALLSGMALIWTILARLAPDDCARGAWLYAANPLSLLALVGSGQNDGLLVVLILLAVLVQLRGRTALAFFVFGLAALVKWVALLLLPAYLVWGYGGRGVRWRVTREFLAGAILIFAVAAGLYGRHLAGGGTLVDLTRDAFPARLSHSLASWTVLRLTHGATGVTPGQPTADSVLVPGSPERRVAWGFGLLFAAWAIFLLRRVYDLRELLPAWGWTLFAYVCLSSAWFEPWYVLWVVALAALAPRTLLARSTLFLSVTALMMIPGPLWVARFGHEPVDLPLYVLLPPLAYAALGYVRRRRLAVPAAPFVPAPLRK